MTLVTRSKPPAYHKKTSGRHHRHSKSYQKPYWPYLPLIAIVIAGAILNSAWPFSKHSVLGYATDMSIQSLLSDTNTQRGDNGLGALGLNAELDTAAQNKANDMAARNYWSHDTPDGKTPWTFITAAGYNYQTAGENLAYGFATAADTVTGWMNSPEHRANILNTTYKEVGFGIANSANYQNSGPETIVVAMYAEPVGAPVAATTPDTAAPSTQATPKPAPVTIGQAAGSSAGASAPAPTPAPAVSVPVATKPAATPAQIEPAQQRVTRVQELTAGNASWSMFVTSLIIAAGLLIFLMRHGMAWHRVLRRGEAFVLKHQLLDVILITLATIGFILTRTSGIIK